MHTLVILCALALIVIVFVFLDYKTKSAIEEKEEVQRWAIGTSDFRFLIESYLDSLKYDTRDAQEIRRELLDQIKKVCPDWDDNKIIVHHRE